MEQSGHSRILKNLGDRIRLYNDTFSMEKEKGYTAIGYSRSNLQLQNGFREAVRWANRVLQFDKIRNLYKQFLKPGFNLHKVAVHDFLNGPKVLKIQYNLNPEPHLLIDAKDDFRVVKVEVTILSANRNIIQHGYANFYVKLNGWKFPLKNQKVQDKLLVLVSASDFPGNISSNWFELESR
jgi:hypothetical protein